MGLLKELWYSMKTLSHSGGGWLISGLIDTKLDDLDFECLHVQQKQFAGILETWYRYDSTALTVGSLNNGGLETRLVAYNVDVRSRFDDKAIFVLEWIAPCNC